MRLEIASRTPMRGVLIADDGPPVKFDGWLELITALFNEAGPDLEDLEEKGNS